MIAVHGGTHRLLHISRRQRGPERLFSFRRAQKRGGAGYRWHSSSPTKSSHTIVGGSHRCQFIEQVLAWLRVLLPWWVSRHGWRVITDITPAHSEPGRCF